MKLKTKLKNILGIFALLLIALMPLASAEETTINTDLDASVELEAGTTPDSAFYGIEKAAESIDMALTFNKQKRAEKGLVHAQERLAEIKVMLDAGKTEEAEKARVRYDKSIETSSEAIAELESDTNEEKSRESLQRVIMLQAKAEAHFDLLLAVKTRILEKRGENITAAQKASFEAFFAKLENKSMEVETRLNAKRANIEIEYKALSGKTDEEMSAEEAQIELELKEKLDLRNNLDVSIRNNNTRQDTEQKNSNEEDATVEANSETRISSDSDGLDVESDIKINGKI